MMLWLLFAALTLPVLGALAFPLVRGSAAMPPQRVDFDVVVYRDQLEELEEEIDRGILTHDQANAARTEIKRRMLAAEEADSSRPGSVPPSDGRRIILVALAAIALVVPGAALMYASLGSPELASTDPSTTGADALEARLKASPSAQGYKQLANKFFAEGRYDKAVAADHRAIDLGANDSSTWSEFGEAMVMAGDGQVPSQALVAFTNAVSFDPTDARARFYIGLAEAQIGKVPQAVAIWRDLLEDGNTKAKWYEIVRQHIDAFSKEAGIDPDDVPPAAPSPDALRSSITAMRGAIEQRSAGGAGSSMGSGSGGNGEIGQDAMIRGMVEKLAVRMKTSPGDASGWTRLAHAYVVLGEPEKAQDAIAHAVRLKPNDAKVQSTLAETELAARLSTER
jgi:cytochrome c-type biogenesis protein CcmH